MEIRHFSHKNKSISFDNQNIDLSQCGIYVINGENGSGKTTLLESILFLKHDIIFSTDKQAQAYQSDRGRLFSYVSQKTLQVHFSIKDYLSMCVPFDENIYNHYAHRLYIDNIDLSEKINHLSGGEKIKVALILGILKDTPYLFLDEPTNHLDDRSVEALKDIITELSTRKTIVIVTHDLRLHWDTQHTIIVQDQKIIQVKDTTSSETIKNDLPISSTQLKPGGLYKHIRNTTWGIAYSLLIAIVCSILCLMNNQKYKDEFEDDEPFPENTIFIYGYFTEMFDLNRTYMQENHITFAEEDARFLTYNDIHSLIQNPDIESIIIGDSTAVSDYMSFKNLALHLQGEKFDVPLLAGIPEIVSDNLFFFSNAKATLVYGRYPHDNAYEVCLSGFDAKEMFHLGFSDPSELIGQTISYENTTYTIVGIIEEDYMYALCSYNAGQDNYFFPYSNPLKNMIIEDPTNPEEVSSALKQGLEPADPLIIHVHNGKEKTVLNELMKEYPLSVYYSNHFNNVVGGRYKKDFFLHSLLPYNIITAIIIGLLLMIIQRQIIKNDYNIIQAIYNITMKPQKEYRTYNLSSLSGYIIPLCYCIFLCMTVSLHHLNSLFLLIDYVIIVTITLLGFVIGGRKNASKNHMVFFNSSDR